MDKPNAPVPPGEDSEQRNSSTAANPASNLPFGGAVEQQNKIPQLLNPYAAAAAAIAMANQQMASQQMVHSLQANMAGSSQPLNGLFIQPTNTNQTNQH